MREKLLIGLLILLILGCEKKILTPKGNFEVRVVTPDYQPVSGAAIEAGFDWEYFETRTDIEGIAVLPNYVRGKSAVIYKNNFFSLNVQSLSSLEYTLTPTPEKLKFIGNVDGWSLKFDSGTLITIGYIGDYHVYSYDDRGVTEIASASLPKSIKQTQLHGDTLWFSTHDDGIYVYSLHNPLQPEPLFHLEIPGYLGPFALKDTIVVVANPWDADTVHILSFDSNGRYHEIGRFGNFLDVGMTFISNYLILLNYYGNLPIIFDLQNPADPQLVYNGVEPDFWSGFFFKNDLILEPLSGSATGTVTYKVVDLSDPSHPQSKGEFSADSHLGQVINDSTAVGTYYFHYSANSVLSGNMSTGFRTVAIVSEGTGADAFGGSAPPYFIIGGRLWKLQE